MSTITNISCSKVLRLVSKYVDNETEPDVRRAIDEHLCKCRHCMALVVGTRNTVLLLGTWEPFELPQGFRTRARKALAKAMRRSS